MRDCRFLDFGNYRQIALGNFQFDCLDSLGATKIEESPKELIATWRGNSKGSYQTFYRIIKPSQYKKLCFLWNGPEDSNIVYFARQLWLRIKSTKPEYWR